MDWGAMCGESGSAAIHRSRSRVAGAEHEVTGDRRQRYHHDDEAYFRHLGQRPPPREGDEQSGGHAEPQGEPEGEFAVALVGVDRLEHVLRLTGELTRLEGLP